METKCAKHDLMWCKECNYPQKTPDLSNSALTAGSTAGQPVGYLFLCQCGHETTSEEHDEKNPPKCFDCGCGMAATESWFWKKL